MTDNKTTEPSESKQALADFVERLNDALGLTEEDVERFNRLWNELIGRETE